MKKPSKLKRLRRSAGLTQEQLAGLCGVARTTVIRHESCGCPTARSARRYAARLGCDWRELIG